MLKESKGYKLNLQLFSDMFGSHAEGIENPIFSGGSSEVDTGTENTEADTQVDIEGETVSTEPTATQDDAQSSQPDFSDIKSKLDMILGKMEKPVEEKEEIEEMAKELTPEDIDKMNNDFYLKFTDKPLETLQELIEERAMAKVAPVMEYFNAIKQQEHWNGVLREFEKEHPDFPEYVQDVSRIIQSDENIRNSKNPIELAYKVAKADKLDSKARPLDQQLKDAGVLKELLSNKDIKNLIVQELKAGGADIPKVIGSEGKTTIDVKEKPKNLSDATKAWLNS